MKNIIDICKELGIEIPEGKDKELTKAVSENYKTIAEHDKVVSKLANTGVTKVTIVQLYGMFFGFVFCADADIKAVNKQESIHLF